MAGRLADQAAIVTGGSRGIGLAIARAFVREGAKVVIASKNPERGRAALDELLGWGSEAIFIATDVTKSDEVQAMVAQTLERFEGLDILVNNAGVHGKAAFWEESEELWERMYQVNVMGTVLPSQAAVRQMKAGGGGAIVHIASKAGVVGEPGHAAYSASKGAVIAMTRGMAVELAPYGIRVNAINPGPVITDMLLADVPDKAGQEKLAAESPLGRLGVPEDVAEATVYLASRESDWCTGQFINLDGGLSILK